MARTGSLIVACGLLVAGCGTPEERLAEQALRTGAELFGDSLFLAADSAFATAPNDARAAYDQGLSQLALGHQAGAAELFGKAAQQDSAGLRPWAFYNRGNALLREAMGNTTGSAALQRQVEQAAPASEDIADRLRHAVSTDSMLKASRRMEARIDTALPEAIAAFKSALRLAPDDEDARHNLVLAQSEWSKRQKERGDGGKNDDKEKTLSERAKLLMQQADELVEKYRFSEALQLLQEGLRMEPSLSTKKEYMDKLDLVTKAAENS